MGALGLVLAFGIGVVVSASPTGAQEGPWRTSPPSSASSPSDRTSMLVVGDSLLIGPYYSVQDPSDHVAEITGRSVAVTATAGGQWVTYGWPGEQNGNALLWEAAAATDARLVVVALGTNDARIMTGRPNRYSAEQQAGVMANAVAMTRQEARCVLLVNVRERGVTGGGGMAASDAGLVNTNIRWVAANDPDGRTYVADWNAEAAGHPGWFRANDVHLSAAGQMAYVHFIAEQSQRLIREHAC